MGEARLIRRVRFRAAHHYGHADASPEENHARFGDQAEPHEHDWTVEVHVSGTVDGQTGWITDLGALDAALDSVMEGWDGGDLNKSVPPVANGTMQPSTESLARWLYETLAGAVPPPAELREVRVFESPDLGAAYPA